MRNLTMKEELELTIKIKEKGLDAERRKQNVYFFRLFKQKKITMQQLLDARDSTLICLGR